MASTDEPQQDGGTLLRLVSRHRLSTTFNFYARIWTDAIMRDIQDNILYVIRNRCEKPARAGSIAAADSLTRAATTFLDD